VVLIPFVFTNQQGVKNRPAVILSIPAYHAERADAIMMPLTSQATGLFADVALSDWRAAGLVKPTYLKACIQTIDRSVIRTHLGMLAADDFALVQATVRTILGL